MQTLEQTDTLDEGRQKINSNNNEFVAAIDSLTVSPITGTAALVAGDLGKLHLLTGTTSDYTVSLPSPTGNSGTSIAFKGSSALTKVVTISPNAAETIDGQTVRKIAKTGVLVLVCDGTNWHVVHEVGSWIPWTPTWTGFSADPTSVDATYFRQGKQVTIRINSTAGTSNATTLTITNLPFVARGACYWLVLVINNGTGTAGRCQVADGSAVLTYFASAGGGAFTGSGTKTGNVTITYEIQ